MDYEKAYTNAVSRIKSIIADKKKQGLTNCLFEGDLNEIFPELKESDNKRISKELIGRIKDAWTCGGFTSYVKRAQIDEWIAWLKKQGEQKPDWNDYDMVVIDAIYNTLNHCGVTKCGLEVTEMLEWLEELEKQGKRNNIVQQLTAFAQHLQKRGAFRDDLCMDFEHEAQSFIEMQNNKEL